MDYKSHRPSRGNSAFPTCGAKKIAHPITAEEELVERELAWTCPCGSANEGGAQFCPKCGTKRAAAWACDCGSQNTAEAVFCPTCGSARDLDAPRVGEEIRIRVPQTVRIPIPHRWDSRFLSVALVVGYLMTAVLSAAVSSFAYAHVTGSQPLNEVGDKILGRSAWPMLMLVLAVGAVHVWRVATRPGRWVRKDLLGELGFGVAGCIALVVMSYAVSHANVSNAYQEMRDHRYAPSSWR